MRSVLSVFSAVSAAHVCLSFVVFFVAAVVGPPSLSHPCNSLRSDQH